MNRYLARMRARGEKFTVAELTPVPAPPNENGAGLMMGAGFPINGIAPNQIPNSMRHVAAGVAIPAVSIRSWSVGGQHYMRLNTNLFRAEGSTNVPMSNAATNSLSRRRGGGPPGPGSSSGAKTWKVVTSRDLASEIAASSNSLALVRAALAYPQLDRALPYWQGFTLMLPHLSRDKTACQWLRAASISALLETNNPAALENLLALAALSHATTNEILMISQLVRIAMLHLAVAATWEALQAEGWNDAQLQELQRALAPNDFVSAMARALEMERALGAMMIDRAAQDPAVAKGLVDMDMNVQWSPPSLPESAEEVIEPLRDVLKNVLPAVKRFIYYPLWKFAWKDQDKLHLLRYWQDAIQRARQQASRPSWSTNKMDTGDISDAGMYMHASGRERHGAIYDRARFLFSSLREGSAATALARAVTADAAQQLAVSAIAVRRFQLAHGTTPDSLDQLVPRFLPAVPIDPFDGQPLRYKRTSNGLFTLYSVGQNCRDEGGDASPESGGSVPHFQNARDLVWPRAATPEEIEKAIQAETQRSGRSTTP